DACKQVVDVGLVVTSPGVAACHPVIRAAVAAGVRVWSELEFAGQSLEVPVYAITGTNGKSTTTTLLGAMIENSGRRVFTGGNLGSPLADAVGGGYDCCVVEVSSFQLEWTRSFHPRVAALLNLGDDHLDRHRTLREYLACKLRLFANMGPADRAVVDPGQAWWKERAGGQDCPFAPGKPSVSGFGSNEAPGSMEGTYFDRSARILEGEGNWTVALPDHWPVAPHDFSNLAAASEMARLIGVESKAVEAAVASFRPLPHRLSLVAQHRGVQFWNDSKATNSLSVLSSLEAMDRPVVLILGGVAKGSDFSAIAGADASIRAVVAYGQAAHGIGVDLGSRFRVVEADAFERAFAMAAGEARAGEAVLLAPACASFDEFGDYAERGERFVELVRGWVDKRCGPET
ncbi:MAG: UDP-N-acetylmuramoyl-L-alanine--D-glutamate ligase, partial [Candidatus Binatia bacterium]